VSGAPDPGPFPIPGLEAPLEVAPIAPAPPPPAFGAGKALLSFGWALAGAALALLAAPVLEELFFRGVLLQGFARSWGLRVSSVLVTVLFWMLHLSETIGYWPANVAIVALAVVALVARLRTGSLGAAVAAHLGYNVLVVAAVYAS
jgi:membrane protease YdiL (CAAX protease family)